MHTRRKRHLGDGSVASLTGTKAVYATFSDGSYAETDADASVCTRVVYTYRRKWLPLPHHLRDEWECVVFTKDERSVQTDSRLLMLAVNPRIDIVSEETVFADLTHPRQQAA